MYALFLVALWVGPHMTFGRVEFALIGSLYLLLGTFLEERNLRKELGGVYDLYRDHVPMWIPRMTPWKQE
jgi:protein-S-isoprenylcysteine O-methyltransferase Ste14